ncbi:MAG TPA: ABC transporter permease [Candidatus Pacearchaeota archaeon]|nr:ABC transporter permease [Candidatus Pacearchaeota archaeon]
MFITDLLEESYSAIFANKTRTALTVLGIVIGISSVIVMVSLGQGATSSIETNIESMGSNLITIMPGFQRTFSQVTSGRGSAQTLTIEDAQAILTEIPFVKNVAPELSRRYQIISKGKNTNTQVIGTVASYQDIKNIIIDEGSFISAQNVLNQAKVAVLGPITRDDLFGEGASAIGETIRINGINFKVIGITKSKGGSSFGSQDDIVYVPITTAQKILAGVNYVSTISVQIQNSKLMNQAKLEITNLLLQRHNITDPQLADFNIVSQQDIIESASSIINTMTILLAAIASISLIVGGIGIMNMMMTTVTERTREIGLRRAIGAKKSDIGLQFLTESVMLTFLGGVIGIILGILISYGITFFTNTATKTSLFSIILAFSVSFLIGVIFGYWPAQKAAKLNPIEALRYE